MKLVWTILFFFIPYVLFCQDFQVTTYHLADGLPSNVTKTINQDTDGFIWIATDKGISRFDGRNFMNISENLPSNYVKSIFISQKQKLILAITDNGIVEIINKKDTIVIKPFGEKMHLPKTIYEDCNGTLWIAQDQAITSYKNGKFSKYAIDTMYWNINYQNYWRSFIFWEDACGRLAVASPSGFFMWFDTQNNKFQSLPIQDPKNILGGTLSFYQVNHVLKTQKNTILVAANGRNMVAEVRLDWKSKKIVLENTYLKGKAPMFFMETPEKEIYVATLTEGLLKLNPNNYNNYHRYDELFFKVCNHLFMDREANIWVNGDAGIAVLKPKFFKQAKFEGHKQLAPDGKTYNISKDSLFEIFVEDGEAKRKFLFRNPLFKKTDITSARIFKEKVYLVDAQNTVYWISKTTVKQKKLPSSNLVIAYVDKQEQLWLTSIHEDKKAFRVSFDSITSYSSDHYFSYLYEDKAGNLWSSSQGNAKKYLYKLDAKSQKFEDQSFENKFDTSNLPYAFGTGVLKRDTQNRLFIGTNGFGLWVHDFNKKTFGQIDLTPEFNNQPINALVLDKNNGVWIGFNIALMYFHDDELFVFTEKYGLPTTNVLSDQLQFDQQNRLWIGTSGGLAFTRETIGTIPQTPQPILLRMEVNKNKATTQNLPFHAFLKVKFASLSYPSERIDYQYRLIRNAKTGTWLACDQNGQLNLAALEEGRYQLEIRAKQQGIYKWSKALILTFRVENAWYRTWWGILTAIILFASTVFLAVALYSNRLRRQKKLLEELVLERTAEIQQQSEEIASQRDFLQDQQIEILKKSQDIESSIRYASRIQTAVLPVENRMKEALPDHFVFYKPRDIVSGDFYWFEKIHQRIFISAADCTGHGVPGAFMSLLASSALNMIVFQKKIYQPAQILQELDISIRNLLKQDSTDNQDGVDMALCMIDLENRQLTFAGAKNPLLLVQENRHEQQTIFVKGDKKPIGGQYYQEINFTEQSFDLVQKNSFYLYSDGFQDQFGGQEGRKFMSRNFKELLVKNAFLDIKTQKTALENAFSEWIGKEYEQIDDVLVLGVCVELNS